MMKKILMCLPLVFLFAFSCFAVGHAETVKKIGVSAGNMAETETRACCEMLEEFFAGQETDSVKYELFFADAGNDAAAQKRQISSLLSQRPDLLVIYPLDMSVLGDLTDQFVSAQVPLVLFGRRLIVWEGWEYRAADAVQQLLEQVPGCYVGGDIRRAGLLQGQILAARFDHGDLNGDGVIHYAVIRDNGNRTESRLRTDMSLQAASKAGLEAVCLSDRSGAADAAGAQEMCARVIREFGRQIEGIICTRDYIAEGVVQAIEEARADVNANLFVLGMDGTDEGVQLVRERKITGTVLVDSEAQDRVMQEAILKALNGEETEKYYFAQYQIIDTAYVIRMDWQNAN